MKKLIIFVLVFAFALTSLASCGEEESCAPVSEASAEASEPVSEISEENQESSEPEEMKDYDFDNISYDVSENIGAPENIEKCEMQLLHATESVYRFNYETEAGLMSLTFTEKDWGTFNLGAWSLTESETNQKAIFVTGSTDMEYVYRAAPAGSTEWVWSGGNHGNEKLVSLEFFDDISGEKINIEEGDELWYDRIKIVEKTKLHYGDENDTYCDVIRTYRIAGKQITLNVDYKYTKDCRFYLSYTCMFPIEKKYGLWADMYGIDGKKLTTIETSRVGKADYSGPANSGNAASRVVVYGEGSDRYSFDVRVNTWKDSVNDFDNDYKTAFWDMNTTSNKIYFSKYFIDKPTDIKKGTEFHTECVWRFCIDGK